MTLGVAGPLPQALRPSSPGHHSPLYSDSPAAKVSFLEACVASRGESSPPLGLTGTGRGDGGRESLESHFSMTETHCASNLAKGLLPYTGAQRNGIDATSPGRVSLSMALSPSASLSSGFPKHRAPSPHAHPHNVGETLTPHSPPPPTPGPTALLPTTCTVTACL